MFLVFAACMINDPSACRVRSIPIYEQVSQMACLMQGQPTVFVLEQGAYEARLVEPGERSGGQTVLKSGVRAGEQVVTAGAYALKARQQKSQLGHGH